MDGRKAIGYGIIFFGALAMVIGCHLSDTFLAVAVIVAAASAVLFFAWIVCLTIGKWVKWTAR